MIPEITKFFAMILALVGPSPKDSPNQIILKEGDKIVAIGDSITAGGGYLRDIDAVLAQQFPQLKTPKVINKGVSGQKAEQLVPRFAKDVIEQKPAVVAISIGINDVWHRLGKPHDEKVLEAYKDNLVRMVEDAQKANIKVILLSPTVIQEDPANEGNKRLKMYVAAMEAVAKEKQCGFVNLHQMFLDALAKKPADTKGNWLTSDGVHMNPRGNAIMAIGVLRALGVSDEQIVKSTPPEGKGTFTASTQPAASGGR